MARPNQPRTLTSEASLRRRIAYEREQRGWSPAGLASRMTSAGCAIQQSAIWKIENADRRITVDELVALGMVFEVPMEELLVDPDLFADQRAQELADQYLAAYAGMVIALDNVADHVRANPGVADAVARALHWDADARRQLFGLPGSPFRDPAPATHVAALIEQELLHGEDAEPDGNGS